MEQGKPRGADKSADHQQGTAPVRHPHRTDGAHGGIQNDAEEQGQKDRQEKLGRDIERRARREHEQTDHRIGLNITQPRPPVEGAA